ncbi:MAG: hypothetical protein ACXIU8_16350 [Alkalilacustris sp.]
MSRYCLIVMRTPLVAHDLALTIQDLTGSTPITADTLSDALETLTTRLDGTEVTSETLVCAMLQVDAATLDGDPLCARLAALSVPVVLLGHSAEMEAAQGEGRPEWPVLPQPFGPAQVAAVLQAVGVLDVDVAARPEDVAHPHSAPTA